MPRVKTKKCALRSCGKEFKPSPFWQKYHAPKCRWTASNRKMLALVRQAKKRIATEEKRNAESI